LGIREPKCKQPENSSLRARIKTKYDAELLPVFRRGINLFGCESALRV
jgi:hypothetical protein